MKLVPVLLVISTALLSRQCEAYQMTRCQLVHELRRQRFPEDLMRDWVCLVENQSSRITDKAKPSCGLFQISSKFWCSNTSTPGKDCNVTCAEMMTDDITKAAACAKKIYSRHKFQAWNGWRNHCSGKPLPDISDC